MAETPTKFTASEALKCLPSISKKRLYEMMNNGSISYEVEEYGSKNRRILDGSELARVFGKKFKPEGNKETEQNTVSENNLKPTETEGNVVEIKLLEQEILFLREKLSDQKALYERLLTEGKGREQDLSQKLDKAFEERTLLLEDHRKRESDLRHALESAQKTLERPKRILGIFARKTA